MKKRKKSLRKERARFAIFVYVSSILTAFGVSTIVNAEEVENVKIETEYVRSIEETKEEVIVLETLEEVEEESYEVDETLEEESKKEMSDDEKYLLAKIAMAEAEGCSLRTKELVIETVLNRVKSDKFPNTIEEVIFQKNQFTPTFDGRWNKVEPNEDCWKAVENVLSAGVKEEVLYFESCKGDSWHSRNLELVCQEDSLRFYK